MNQPTVEQLLGSYQPDKNAYDEVRANGCIRPHWNSVVNSIAALATDSREKLWSQADETVRKNGVTYNAFADGDMVARPWEMDLFPLTLAEADWQPLSAALVQRTRLLQAIVRDVYGPKTMLTSGLVPPELVFLHPGYLRPFEGLVPSSGSLVTLCGFELARTHDGSWRVMADRFDAPAGAGYALENRIVISRVLSHVIQSGNVQRLAPFFHMLAEHLRSLALRNVAEPRVVILTSGNQGATYFEDVFLAQYLGLLLVEPSDLAVRDDDVFVKMVDGLLPVDVIFSRVPDSSIDPLEVAGGNGGVAGLVNAVRQRRVVLTNALGTGIVESPIWMRFLPQLCQQLLGEQLMLPSIRTWWCGYPDELVHVVANLDQLVVKPAFEFSGGQESFAERLSPGERERLIADIQANPSGYVAQERVIRSASPCWTNGEIHAGYNALRTFVTASPPAGHGDTGSFHVMPGALVRVSDTTAPMDLSISAGARSADAWVLSSQPVQVTSNLPKSDDPLPIRRNAHLVPARIADNFFWIGMELDSVEVVARLLRTVFERVESDRATHEIPEIPSLLRALVGVDLLEPGYAIEELESALPSIEIALTAALTDGTRQKTIRSSVNEIQRIASNARDRISRDTWQAVCNLSGALPDESAQGTISPSACFDSLDKLLTGLAAVSGLIGDGMVRGAAWRFYEIGRAIGRAQKTVAMLREANLVEADTAVLETLLEVMDSRITYRSRYLAEIRPLLVLDLLVLDESNPRSLAFQLATLSAQIDCLPKSINVIGLSESQAAIVAVHRDLQLKAAEWAQVGSVTWEPSALTALLNEQAEGLAKVYSAVTRTYLTHSREIRKKEGRIWNML